MTSTISLLLRRTALIGLLFLVREALAIHHGLPPPVVSALVRAKIPVDAVSVFVQAVDEGHSRKSTQIAWRAGRPVNPASLMKLVTTYAALELLGPAWAWRTPVWLHGELRRGVLEGNLVIKGSGDPTLVLERIWLLLRKIRQQGVDEIRGDIVLDRSAFATTNHARSAFDSAALRPYNVQPDALLLNYKALLIEFAPDVSQGTARVTAEPPLIGVHVDARVPLATGRCRDWRTALKIDAGHPARIRFLGKYLTSCGDKIWPLAYAEPESYNARLFEALWREAGGKLSGHVRDGRAPNDQANFEFTSKPLAQVVRDINKFSNNVMAQQLFLTLGLQTKSSGTLTAAREVVKDWLARRLGKGSASAVIDNGSGLSRESRLSAVLLGALLQRAWASPVMPELLSSLPVLGLDGTLRNFAATAGNPMIGRAHLKTGSLRGVNALAGYVLSQSGARYVLVAIVNHPKAREVKPALEALVQWTVQDRGAKRASPNR